MRSAIVTGCSRGIGRAVTEMLLDDGWEVFGVSRTLPGLSGGKTADERFLRFSFVPWDLSGDEINAAGYRPSEVFCGMGGEIDALVHCAGIRGPYGSLMDADPAAWLRTIDTNLLGTYRVVRAALPLLQRSDDARILLMSGGGAFGPSSGYSAYGCSKAAVVALAETLAEELQSSTVTINAIAPGFIATGIHRQTPLEGTPDNPEAMPNAIACIRHMLSPAAYGVSGRTISAQHDDWRSITPMTVPALMASRMGLRDRIKVQRLAEAARCAAHHRVPAGMV